MQGGPKAAGAEASLFPEGLSLEELLESVPKPASGLAAETTPESAPAPTFREGVRPEGEAVFDLTADMQGPSLPLVEVGTGEPPALSVEDLLRPAGAAPLEAGIGGVPEVQIEPLSERKPEAIPSPEVPPVFEPLFEIPSVQPRAAAAPVAVPPPVVPAMVAVPPFAALAPEMGMLRQAVTERVAHELAKELSDTLIERIERIVWDVVPDLAEILINREIERLRAMTEGKQSS